MSDDVAGSVASVLGPYSPDAPEVTAQGLRQLWLGYAPNRGIELVKAEQRAQYESVGIPIPVLKAIGNAVAKSAGKDVSGFLPLAQLLWDDYGREGRVVALITTGAMELAEPQRIVPRLKEWCGSCVSWEDADRLAMDALEPIVRKHPEEWLGEIAAWLDDENKWVRRASVTVIARLPMKHPAYVGRCLELTERLLPDTDTDVKRAVSFSIRLCAKADSELVRTFLEKHVPASDPAAVWVLCDAIRSMDRKILPAFASLAPRYEEWIAEPGIGAQDRRTIESAIKRLQASTVAG